MERVYTFFQDLGINPEAKWLLNAWTANWARAGWEPIILGIEDAARHPRSAGLRELFASWPTVNDPRYEQACFARWLAYAMQPSGGLAVDYDVFAWQCPPFAPGELTFHERNRVPCAVSASRDGFESLVDYLENYKLRNDDMQQGRQHISDQYVLTRHRDSLVFDQVTEHGEGENWMMHFSNSSCPGGKGKHIRRFFSERGMSV